MTQPQIEYQIYLQQLGERSTQVIYDQDERPVYVKTIEKEPTMSFTEWMKEEMKKAIEQEDYEYAAQIRDEYKTNNL